MGKFTTITLWVISILAANKLASPQPENISDANTSNTSLELVRYQNEFSTARLEAARMRTHIGIAVIFEGTNDIHYYAKSETAPAPGFELKVEAKSDVFEFGKPIFPKWHIFIDSLDNKVEVYSGKFTIFIPMKAAGAPAETAVEKQGDVEVKISGIACTELVCLPPFEKILRARIDISDKLLKEISLETPQEKTQTAKGAAYPAWFALLLAFIAGLTLNIMPCVWPVLPLIVMQVVKHAAKTGSKTVVMGFTFCCGILLFFASLAGANIILKLFYATVLQWGDQFRNQVFLTGMVLLLVALAMSMFGVFSIILPPSIAGKPASGKGYFGAIGMGFLAAILSTPCGFGVLAASFGWAQAQNLPVATVAIMVIGLGMAAPYAILTSLPGLLNRLPKAGRWMELFKQGIGFVLLVIAVKLVSALPEARRMNVLYFSVALAFCIWMWSSWVGYNTKKLQKYLIRIAAVAIAIAAGWIFLSVPAGQLIDWQDYNADTIENALAEGRPVLIKFTAKWCLACQAAEKMVYSREDIVNLIEQKDVLAIKADTTEKNFPATIALRNVYNEPGVPVSILCTPGQKEPTRWHGFLFADQLEKSLSKLTDRKQNGEKAKDKDKS
jgi:thiol:disulfide interchange protein